MTKPLRECPFLWVSTFMNAYTHTHIRARINIISSWNNFMVANLGILPHELIKAQNCLLNVRHVAIENLIWKLNDQHQNNFDYLDNHTAKNIQWACTCPKSYLFIYSNSIYIWKWCCKCSMKVPALIIECTLSTLHRDSAKLFLAVTLLLYLFACHRNSVNLRWVLLWCPYHYHTIKSDTFNGDDSCCIYICAHCTIIQYSLHKIYIIIIISGMQLNCGA